MNDAACRPEELTTAMVLDGVGMDRFDGRSRSMEEERGNWTGEKPRLSSVEVQGRCLSLFVDGGGL